MSDSLNRPDGESAEPASGAPGPTGGRGEARGAHRWTFLSNHAHVLICLAKSPGILLREVAVEIGITERAVMKIVSDLEHEGLLVREREGRRNTYTLTLDQPLRHPIEKHRSVAELVQLILEDRE